MEAKNRPSPIAAKKFNSNSKTLKQNGMLTPLLSSNLLHALFIYSFTDESS